MLLNLTPFPDHFISHAANAFLPNNQRLQEKMTGLLQQPTHRHQAGSSRCTIKAAEDSYDAHTTGHSLSITFMSFVIPRNKINVLGTKCMMSSVLTLVKIDVVY